MKGDFIAVIAGIAALLGLFTAVIAARTALKVQRIAVNVDGNLSRMINREIQLTAALEKSDTDVPPQPEIDHGNST